MYSIDITNIVAVTRKTNCRMYSIEDIKVRIWNCFVHNVSLGITINYIISSFLKATFFFTSLLAKCPIRWFNRVSFQAFKSSLFDFLGHPIKLRHRNMFGKRKARWQYVQSSLPRYFAFSLSKVIDFVIFTILKQLPVGEEQLETIKRITFKISSSYCYLHLISSHLFLPE